MRSNGAAPNLQESHGPWPCGQVVGQGSAPWVYHKETVHLLYQSYVGVAANHHVHPRAEDALDQAMRSGQMGLLRGGECVDEADSNALQAKDMGLTDPWVRGASLA